MQDIRLELERFFTNRLALRATFVFEKGGIEETLGKSDVGAGGRSIILSPRFHIPNTNQDSRNASHFIKENFLRTEGVHVYITYIYRRGFWSQDIIH